MITTVTLNASIDKAYYLDKPLLPGAVTRVQKNKNTAGGKGLNVARVAKLCGSPVLATGLVGGFNGQYLEHLLEEDGIPSQFTHVAGETRSCLNILDSEYGSTELLEAGNEITDVELADFIMNYRGLLAETDIVVLSGSLPKGVCPSIYATLIDLAKKADKQVILDSSGKSFESGLCVKPTLVKPNKEELEALFDCQITGIEETLKYAQKLAEQGIDYVVVSLGGEGAVLIHQGLVYHGLPPKIKAVNTVGCGDSMVAALAVGLQANNSPEDCLKYAVAVGTANASSPDTGNFDKGDLERIYKQVQVSII